MNPERAADLVTRWVRLYTRGLPHPVAERRRDELRADLDDHLAHDRSHGVGEARIAIAILSRMVRGMPDDLAWRRHMQPTRGDHMKLFVGLVGAALATGALALVLDSPLLVLAAVAVLGVAALIALALGVRSAQRVGAVGPFIVTLGAGLGVAATAVAAIVIGERGDAPGLILLGVAMVATVVVGAFALGMRTAQRSSR